MIIGLIGGIASGKTEVAKCLEKKGFRLVEADKIGHSIYNPGTEAYQQLLSAFGHDILHQDKTINRSVLGNLVFSDASQLTKLNSIIHPPLISSLKDIIASARKIHFENLVIDAALLVEFGLVPLMDSVILVLAPLQDRLIWLQKCRNLSDTEALKRIMSQTDPIIWAQNAHHIILNLGSLDELHDKTQKLHNFLTKLDNSSRSISVW